MPVATEFAAIPLKEGVHPEDPASPSHAAFQKVFQTILAQDGARNCLFGRQVEDPTLGLLFIDWDSIEHHNKFIASEVYKTFLEGILKDLAGAPALYHVHFDPLPIDAWTKGGATEVFNAYFPADYSESDIATFDANVKEFLKSASDVSPEIKAATGGWAVEHVEIPGTQEKGRLFNGLISWTSVAAHQAFRESEWFKNNIHVLRGAKDIKGVKAYHVTPVEVKKN
ncbi:hypothetical protein B0A52_10095 [Exophiala mesophila]|uniref:ABM domain-containing protein n=1 Tax=Exophiala mesophila TaxID=212818 RepID=A0A438MRE6_EXOME|nr:hypothetical protein B0A52_10095 [Exophiala mesophila]